MYIVGITEYNVMKRSGDCASAHTPLPYLARCASVGTRIKVAFTPVFRVLFTNGAVFAHLANATLTSSVGGEFHHLCNTTSALRNAWFVGLFAEDRDGR